MQGIGAGLGRYRLRDGADTIGRKMKGQEAPGRMSEADSWVLPHRRWAQAFGTDTWHLAYEMSPQYWVAECRGFTTYTSAPIVLKRSTLRVHPKAPLCQRCQRIARAYQRGAKT